MKKGFKSIIPILIYFLASGTAFGQQDAHYSMYMFNGLALNPAYAGSNDAFSLKALYRHQWVGIEGAPKTVVFAAHGPVSAQRIGLGLTLTNDMLGVTNMFTVAGDFAYRIKFNRGTLAGGIRASLSHLKNRWEDLTLSDITDNAFVSNADDNLILPNFGTGIYFYTDRFFMGASVPHLLNNSLNVSWEIESSDNVARLRNHYFFTTGYKIRLSDNFDLEPSVLCKYVNGAPFQVDFNAMAHIRDALSLGASYRSGDAIIGLISYNINKNLVVGYAYDWSLTELNDYNSGSHEIMIGYDFLPKYDKYITPRKMTYW